MRNTATNTEVKSTNSLVYKVNRVKGGKSIYVTIRLNDECKNGHQDFAITANIFEAGKPKTDKYLIWGGCCHDEILKAFPEFEIFVNLHLCDYLGIPMHCSANGFYHLDNGFNDIKPENPNFETNYCKYYRITPDQFSKLKESKNEIQFALKLEELGVFEQWKKEANKAISILEELTGSKFIVDSKRTQYHRPSDEAIKEELERQVNGYYTPEAEAKREGEKIQTLIAELEAERYKEVKKADTEYQVKKEVLLVGGEKALKNCIFYNHSQTLAFNWKGYDRIGTELIEKIISTGKFPEGVKIENANK